MHIIFIVTHTNILFEKINTSYDSSNRMDGNSIELRLFELQSLFFLYQ